MSRSSRKRQSSAANQPAAGNQGAVGPVSQGTFRDLLLGAVLILGVVLIYLPLGHAGFVWDDDDHVTANPCVVGPLGLKEIWTTSNARYYPLVLTTFWIEHALWGLQPAAFHFFNVLLQGACAVLLWRVLRNLGVTGAWLGAALWAFHPVQVESVAWITELKNVQSGFFYLLCILSFVRWLKTRTLAPAGEDGLNYGLALLFAALAMASKSSTVVLPLILALCAWWVEGRLTWRILIRIAPVLLMSVAAAALAVWTVDLQGVNQDTRWIRTWPERLITAGNVFWFYLGKLVWPHPLIFIYPRLTIRADHVLAYVPLFAGACLMAVLWANRRSWGRPYFLALAYFLIALLPVLGLVEHYFLRYSFVADHLQYLASMGPAALLGAGLSRFAEMAPLRGTPLRFAFAAGLLFVLGLVSWQRTWTYQSDEILWTDTVAQNPGSWMAYNNLGEDLFRQGRFEAAMSHYKKAVEIDPTLPQPHYNLGLALAVEQRFGESLSDFQQAVEIDPDYEEAHYNMGNVYLQIGQLSEAKAQFHRVLEINPHSAVAYNNLGVLALRERDWNGAEVQFLHALQLNPDNAEAKTNLARVRALQAASTN